MSRDAEELTLRELWALSAAVWGVDVRADPDARSDVLSMAVTFLGLKEKRPELLTICHRDAEIIEQDMTLRGRPARWFSVRESLTVCTTEAGHAVLRAAGLNLPSALTWARGSRPASRHPTVTLPFRFELFATVPCYDEARRRWALARLDEQLGRVERAWELAAEREPHLGEQDRQLLAAAIYLCELERAIKSPDAVELVRWHKRDWQRRDHTSFLPCDTNEVCPLGLMLKREGAAGVRSLALVRWAQQLGLVGWTELLSSPEPKLRETEALVARWRQECGP